MIPNRKEKLLETAEKYFVKELTKRGSKPEFQKLDNEISQPVKQYMKQNNITFQLVPTYIHQHKRAETTIQTFKDHFIAGLCTFNPNFPLYLWDKLIPIPSSLSTYFEAAESTPNFWHISNCTVIFITMRHQWSHQIKKVLVFEPPAKRGSYSPHGIEGWYIGPALNHYRYWQIYVPSTGGIRHTETVNYFLIIMRCRFYNQEKYWLTRQQNWQIKWKSWCTLT